ncbi:MAG: M6 family metalloprotease domain-containing protein [Bacteroidales bacterium]
MTFIKVSFLTLFMVLFTGIINVSYSIPARRGYVTVTQSDGTKLSIRIFGDEFNHYVLSQDGYTLVGGVNGDYYYAKRASNGSLVPTAIKAKPMDKLTKAERAQVMLIPKGIKSNVVNSLRKGSMHYLSMPKLNSLGGAGAKVKSKINKQLRSLVILVTFKDRDFVTAAPQQSFLEMLNMDGYNKNEATGSAWNYYYDNSNGQFDPKFDVVGPYHLPNTMSYYADKTGIEKGPEMIVDACKQASVAGVDFSQYADNGNIRDVFVFYAGYNQAEGTAGTIWPHRWNVEDGGYNIILNGVKLGGYACSSELTGTSGGVMAGIGTFCHEFGHVLGWPDFYDTDYEESGGYAAALENYSLMCDGAYNNNGMTPPALNILERWLVGWAEPKELLISGDYALAPVTKDKGEGYLIKTATENEYFLMENRCTGNFIWDEYLPNGSKGMLVYHIDRSSQYSQSWIDNTLNCNPDHECVKLVRSVPTTPVIYNYPAGKTFFPGYEEITQFTNNTAFKAWNGSAPFVDIEDIKLDNGVIKFLALSNDKIHLKITPNQYDAMIVLKGKKAECTISWQKQGESTVLGTAKGVSDVLHLNNLQPATTYNVIVITKDATSSEQSFTFTTNSISKTANVRINLSKVEYSVTEPITLSILDYKGNLKQINWYIDDKPTKETYFKLHAGEYRIMAAIVDKNDEIEYIIKYITVK